MVPEGARPGMSAKDGSLQRYGDWSVQVSSSGKKYYYNFRTSTSQWEKPVEWVEYEGRERSRQSERRDISNHRSHHGSQHRSSSSSSASFSRNQSNTSSGSRHGNSHSSHHSSSSRYSDRSNYDNHGKREAASSSSSSSRGHPPSSSSSSSRHERRYPPSSSSASSSHHSSSHSRSTSHYPPPPPPPPPAPPSSSSSSSTVHHHESSGSKHADSRPNNWPQSHHHGHAHPPPEHHTPAYGRSNSGPQGPAPTGNSGSGDSMDVLMAQLKQGVKLEHVDQKILSPALLSLRNLLQQQQQQQPPPPIRHPPPPLHHHHHHPMVPSHPPPPLPHQFSQPPPSLHHYQHHPPPTHHLQGGHSQKNSAGQHQQALLGKRKLSSDVSPSTGIDYGKLMRRDDGRLQNGPAPGSINACQSVPGTTFSLFDDESGLGDVSPPTPTESEPGQIYSHEHGDGLTLGANGGLTHARDGVDAGGGGILGALVSHGHHHHSHVGLQHHHHSLLSQGVQASSQPPPSFDLTPFAKYVNQDLTGHLSNPVTDSLEKQLHALRTELHHIGNVQLVKCASALKRDRSLVRVAEIQSTRMCQRIMSLQDRQKAAESKDLRQHFQPPPRLLEASKTGAL